MKITRISLYIIILMVSFISIVWATPSTRHSKKSPKKESPTTNPSRQLLHSLFGKQGIVTKNSAKKEDAGAQLRRRVVEVKLKNGMIFLLVRREGAPTFSANIRVKVGGVDEQIGYTGLAHILEHMAFKGTAIVGSKNWKKEKRYLKKLNQIGDLISNQLAHSGGKITPQIKYLKKLFKKARKQHQHFVRKGEFSKIYEINGGTGLNATTGKDLTSYFISLPSNRLRLWAQQEAARLTAPVFREFFKERSVVTEEKRMGMSKGSQKLYEQFLATAFIAHPYRFPVVGWMSDITTIPSQKMVAFFKKYYSPSNIVVSIVGDIDITQTKKILNETFALIPASPKPPAVRTREPKQNGERRVIVRHNSYPLVMIGFHKPTAPDPDDDVFDIIEALLTSGRSSRLYKALVKKRFAQSVWASSLPGARYPNLFTITAKPIAPHNTKTLEKLIYAELDKLKTTLVSKRELQKIHNQNAMAFLKGLRSNSGLASQLSYFQAVVGDWHYATYHSQRLARVTPKAIMRVARQYFKSSNRTVGTLVRITPKQLKNPIKKSTSFLQMNPKLKKISIKKFILSPSTKVVLRELPKNLKIHPMKIKIAPLKFTPPKPRILTLANGIKLYLLEDKELPLISIYGLIRTGRIYDPIDKIGLAELTGSVMRSGGFGKIKGDQLDELLAFRAATLSNSIHSEYGFAKLSIHRKDLDWGLDKLYKMLRYPRFSPNKILLKKAQMLEKYRRRNDNPFYLGMYHFQRLIYGTKTRWSKRPTPQSIKKITRNDLIKFHRRYYVPNHIRLAIVGDFDSKILIPKLKKLFKDWHARKVSFPKLPPIPKRTKPVVALIRRRLPQSIILVGHSGPRRHTPHLLAGKMMNYILGGASFGSRLVTEIRIKRGLAYFAGSILQEGRDRGIFAAYTGTSPHRTGKTLKLLLKLLKKMHLKGNISSKELKRTQKTFLNRFIFLFNSSAQIVYQRAYYDYFNYPSDYLENYRKKLLRLTKQQLEQTGKTFIDPSQFVILVIGWDPAFDIPLKKFGKVLHIQTN